MYFLALDIFHILALVVFLIATLGLVYFRARRFMQAGENMTNYILEKRFFAIRMGAFVLCILLLGFIFLKPVGLHWNHAAGAKGIDIVWVLDTSLSMDVMDVGTDSRAISRLMRAKSIIENEMVAHPENRYGLVIFAGKARLVSPLTTEHTSLLSFLSSIDSKSIQEGGTDFKEALSVATERFSQENNDMPHAIVLLSDGGDQEDAPDNDTIKSVFSGKAATLITIGIGQTKPSPIQTGTSPFGEAIYKQFQGQVVLSGLNRNTLKNLAESGNGKYVDGNKNDNSLDQALSTIASHDIANSPEASRDRTIYFFILASFLCLSLFLLLPSTFLKKGNAS